MRGSRRSRRTDCRSESLEQSGGEHPDASDQDSHQMLEYLEIFPYAYRPKPPHPQPSGNSKIGCSSITHLLHRLFGRDEIVPGTLRGGSSELVYTWNHQHQEFHTFGGLGGAGWIAALNQLRRDGSIDRRTAHSQWTGPWNFLKGEKSLW